MHFKHILAKSQPKNMELFNYSFLALRGNIRLGVLGPLDPSLGYALDKDIT